MTYSRLTGENQILIHAYGGIHISMKIPKTPRQNEVNMSFWIKRGQFTGQRESKHMVSKFTRGHPERRGKEGNPELEIWLGSSLSDTCFIHMC